MKATVKILRWDPKTTVRPRYETYTVPFSPRDKVLGSLLYIYRNLDPCLSFRFNCKGRHCGECAIMINGRPGLSCAVPMSRELTLKPLENLPVIKDLVIDRSQVYKTIIGYLPKTDVKAYDAAGLRPVPLEVIDRVVRLDACIHCMCCMAVCPAYKKAAGEFPGPVGLLALATLAEQTAGPNISQKAALCSECGQCEKACPRHIPILTEAITRIKKRTAPRSGKKR